MQVDNSSIILGRWTRLREFLLDFAAVVLVSTDMLTDVLVIQEFYVAGKMTVFWVGVGILCCAQISYLLLFFVIFIYDSDLWGSNYCEVGVFFTMLLAVPFGQLVPLFIWIIGSWGTSGPEPITKEDYIWKHVGFIIESFVQAFPQSILQIVALLYYKKVTALSLYSIISSITSIAIRGVIFSHSLSIETYIFNCACFALDIFNIFSCFSWAFWETDINFPWEDNFWQFTQPVDIYGQIWFNQLLCIAATLGFIFAVSLTISIILVFLALLTQCLCYQCEVYTCPEITFTMLILMPVAFAIIVTVGFTGLAVLIMVFPIFKLSAWCIVWECLQGYVMYYRPWLNWLSSSPTSYLEHRMFYRPWLNWLLSSPTSFDRERRVGVSFKNLARRNLLNDRRAAELQQMPLENLTCRVLRRDIFGKKSNTSEFFCGLPRQCATWLVTEAFNGVSDDWWDLEHYIAYGFFRIPVGVFFYVLLPLHIIYSVYSCIYPFLAFSKVGIGAHPVQVVFSEIYFLLLGVALLFFPAMYRYWKLVVSIPVQSISLPGTKYIPHILATIGDEYTMELSQRYIEQIVHNFFQEQLGSLIMEILGPQRHLALDKEIFFLRDPLQYRDLDRLTIYDFEDARYITREVNDTNEIKLYSADLGLKTPLLASQEDEGAKAKFGTKQRRLRFW